VLYERSGLMNEAGKTTLEKILACALSEFSAKGFRLASLRNIVKEAGVTTGAFYGYFKSKEELFDALVKEKYDVFTGMYKATQEEFAALPDEQQLISMGELSGECLERMMEYAYEYKEIFRLLLCSSEGTRYENMVHEMVEIEVEATHAFAHVMKRKGKKEYCVDPTLEHILVSGMFSAFFEMIIHDVPYNKASKYLSELRSFYTAGWKKLMGF